MKIKIESDGTAAGTSVVVGETEVKPKDVTFGEEVRADGRIIWLKIGPIAVEDILRTAVLRSP